MKIALSASFWDQPEVQEVLKDCDAIYTTNVRARDQLWALFGEGRVKFIPCATEEMMSVIKNWYRYDEDVTFIEFGDLFKLGCRPKEKASGP